MLSRRRDRRRRWEHDDRKARPVSTVRESVRVRVPRTCSAGSDPTRAQPLFTTTTALEMTVRGLMSDRSQSFRYRRRHVDNTNTGRPPWFPVWVVVPAPYTVEESSTRWGVTDARSAPRASVRSAFLLDAHAGETRRS